MISPLSMDRGFLLGCAGLSLLVSASTLFASSPCSFTLERNIERAITNWTPVELSDIQEKLPTQLLIGFVDGKTFQGVMTSIEEVILSKDQKTLVIHATSPGADLPILLEGPVDQFQARIPEHNRSWWFAPQLQFPRDRPFSLSALRRYSQSKGEHLKLDVARYMKKIDEGLAWKMAGIGVLGLAGSLLFIFLNEALVRSTDFFEPVKETFISKHGSNFFCIYSFLIVTNGIGQLILQKGHARLFVATIAAALFMNVAEEIEFSFGRISFAAYSDGISDINDFGMGMAAIASFGLLHIYLKAREALHKRHVKAITQDPYVD